MLLAQPKQAISNIFPFPFCDLLKYVIIDLEKAKKNLKRVKREAGKKNFHSRLNH